MVPLSRLGGAFAPTAPATPACDGTPDAPPIGAASAENAGPELGCGLLPGATPPVVGGMAGDEPGLGCGACEPPGWFIINIVPLNFGAAVFIANPHFVQVVAVSGFCIPQFGQNTRGLRLERRAQHTF